MGNSRQEGKGEGMPMEGFITDRHFEEYEKRMEDEHRRMNKRIELLEEGVQRFGAIAVSVEKLAMNMEGMLKEQERQGERLEKLEQEPADRWNTMTRTVFTTVVSAISGGLAVALVALASQYVK